MNEAGPIALVLGAGGLVGGALCDELPRAGWRLCAAPRADCDISDAAAVRALCERTRPGAVFNAAAYTNVDGAETEPGLALAVNGQGAESVARRPPRSARPWSTTRPISSSTERWTAPTTSATRRRPAGRLRPRAATRAPGRGASASGCVKKRRARRRAGP
jgi:NAD(P)-dependent dehydrogenase (short-subunit alcohol dehydrogenase family)